jgi:hypothetical protein
MAENACNEPLTRRKRLLVCVGRWLCWVQTGHNSMLKFENGRMSLQCSGCGKESPGWDVRGRDENHLQVSATRRGRHNPIA